MLRTISFFCLLAFNANADHLKTHAIANDIEVNYSAPQDISVGQFFELNFTFSTPNLNSSIDRLSFKAFMPSHKHGLNYQPQITKTSDKTFKVEYLNFHMPGHWKVQINAFIEDKKHPFEFDFNLL